MDSSSEDESVFNHRKSSVKKIFDSDDEADGKAEDNLKEATEDFRLHLSDDEGDDGEKENTEEDPAQENVFDDNGSVRKEDFRVDESSGSSSRVGDDDNVKANVAVKSLSFAGTLGATDVMKKLSALADSDSESDIDGDLEPLPKSTKKSKLKSKSCIASESDDSGNERSQKYSDDDTKESLSSSKGKQRKPGPERKSKTKAKDAMLEIKAESQRQLRQSNIGLPYHVPKQRSLLDFLNRRKTASPMPIKGPVEQLAAVWKQIEDREKEVEEFYKSESEQESDEEEKTQEAEPPEKENEQSESQKDMSLDLSQRDTVLSTGPGDSGVETDASLSGTPSGTEPNLETAVDTENEETVSTDSAQKMESENVTEVDMDEVPCTHSNDLCHKQTSSTNMLPETELSEKLPMENALSLGDRHAKCLLETQDSQGISLHYSETETLMKTDSANLKEAIVEKDLTNLPSGVADEFIDESSDAASKSKGSTWEELNSAMKDLEDNCEDFESKEIVPQKPSLGSGARLSLKGAPSDMIDLDDVNSNPKTPGVKGLIERFMKHSTSKKAKPQTVELSVISSEKNSTGGVVEVKHESFKLVLSTEESVRSDNNITPGARLKLLKTELNRQMRKQKGEEWQKKHEEMKNEQVFYGEKDDCGMEADEEEEEMTDSEAESEPEINDVRESKKKKKVKSAFVDEEAEVDEEEGDAEDRDEKESSDDESDDDGSLSGNDLNKTGDDDSLDDNDEASRLEVDCKKKSCVEQMEDEETCGSSKASTMPRTMTSASADLFASQSTEWRVDDDDDDFIPAGQPKGVTRDFSFTERNDETKERDLLFSPMSLSIPGKTQSYMDIDPELTPQKMITDMKPQSSLKKLFGESQVYSTQDKLKEIAGLFADKFNDSQDRISDLANVSNGGSETDLMALCSGKFVTQPPLAKDLEEDGEQMPDSQLTPTQPSGFGLALENEDSVDFSLKFDGDAKNSEDGAVKSNEGRGSFRLEIMSSDEEDNTTLIKERKKKRKKLEFSDDEDDEDDNRLQSDAEDSDTQQNQIESDEEENVEEKKSKLFDIFSKPSKEVFYDSDENEIEPGDFLEKEAELSEEDEWNGSDDEDEKGLDQLEMNEADKEDIDQDQVREQLVKNHMQKMLDEDRRDVRILQEMLLEDGELHSDAGGRERQFRWKNVDSTGMGDDGQRSDEEQVDNDDEEDDAVWRKQRHEREMFLKEQREKQKKEGGVLHEDADEDKDEVLENSELLQLGKSVLFKSRSTSLEMSAPKDPPPSKLTVHNPLLSPDAKKGSIFLSKRGSFLSRGDGVLAKLAKITGSAKENAMSGPTRKGNFVFSAISPPKNESQPKEDIDTKSVKRKATAGITNIEKKPCLVPSVRKSSGLFDHL